MDSVSTRASVRVLLAIAILAGMSTACGAGSSTASSTAGSTAISPSGSSSSSGVPPPQPTKSLYLAGNASPTFGAGEPGKVAVVAQAPLALPVPSGGETLPIAVRNNTSGSVTEITAQGIVRDAGGKVVGTGTDQGFHPALLQLGEVALGFIYLGIGTNVPAGSYMTVQASGKPASSSNTYFADLLVTEVNNTGQQVVGTIKNPRTHAVQAPYSVDVYCTDRSGGLREIGGFADSSADLGPGATSGFSVDLAGTPCPQFIVGASGFDQSAAGN
jgi:hypothetical protein